jgi:hypothetical protein
VRRCAVASSTAKTFVSTTPTAPTLSVISTCRRCSCPTSTTRKLPLEHALRLSAAMPQARLLRTWGLGHNRVLKDAATVAAVTHFIRGDEALPALPQSAPIH